MTWAVPAFPNGIIIDYEVQYYRTMEGNSSATLNHAGNINLIYVVTNLEEYTNYSVQVRVVVFHPTTRITGDFSLPVNAETNPEGL